jgi:uncharacterized protein YqgC (DUF456 family)
MGSIGGHTFGGPSGVSSVAASQTRRHGMLRAKTQQSVTMDWITYLVAALFCLFGALCVLLVVLQLPGTWIMLLTALLIEWADRLYITPDPAITFGWWVLGVCAALAAIGEVIEFLAGAAGAKRAGATRRGVIGAIVGGVGGGIALTFMLPIPVLGTLIGAVVGSFTGAIVGEVTGATPMTVRGSMRPAVGASIGRVVGTLGKLGIAIVVWLVLSVGAFVPS